MRYSYILVSSRNGHNFDHVIHKIKMIKERAKEDRLLKPKIFVLGNTNVGKSSFINKLVQRSNRFLKSEDKNRQLYQKDYNITDSTVYNEDKKESNLTTSPLPGTTIGITRVDSMTLGIRVYL